MTTMLKDLLENRVCADEIDELEQDEGLDEQLSQLKARVKQSDTPASVSNVNQNAGK